MPKNDKLGKRSPEAPRWLEKKVDTQGVAFLTGSRPYMRYVEGLSKIYNEGDRPFYDAIKNEFSVIPWINMSLVTEEERVAIYNLLRKYDISLTQITPSQRLAVFGIQDDNLEQLKQDLLNIVAQRDGIHVTYVQNCPGKNQCKYSVADSLSLGRKLEQLSFSTPFPRKVKISIAACRMCCTEPYVRDVGIIASRKGWTLVFGGNGGGRPRIADRIAQGLTDDEVVKLVKKCLDFYMKHTRTKQRTARFIEQYGIDRFKKQIL